MIDFAVPVVGEKKKSDQPTVVKLSDLYAFLYDVQKTFLDQLRECLPTMDVFREPITDLQTCSGKIYCLIVQKRKLHDLFSDLIYPPNIQLNLT